MRYRVVATAI